jgi:hypothetical protein
VAGSSNIKHTGGIVINNYNIDEINFEITNIDFWSHSKTNKGGMRIYWSSDVGFGTLDIIKVKGNKGGDFDSPKEELVLHCYTECMDSENDKSFIKKILSLLANNLVVVG